MLERFYPGHVLWRLGTSEQEFWDSKALPQNDWAGLAALLYSDIFSLDILSPLSDTDTCFRLEVSAKQFLITLIKSKVFFYYNILICIILL